MSIEDKNKGLFSDIKGTVNLGDPMDTDGQKSENKSNQEQLDPKQMLERELIKRLSHEKHRLAAELEIKFKEANAKRMEAQEKKLKQLLAEQRQVLEQEKQKYEQALKQKYSRIMKAALQERQKELTEKAKAHHKDVAAKVKSEHYAAEAESRQKIEQLEQQLANLQQENALQLTEATIKAKQEQEQASRAFYDNIMQSTREEVARQTELKLRAEFEQKQQELARKEQDFKREYEIAVKKQNAKLMNTYEERLRDALFEQEQAMAKANNEQLSRQSELFNHRIQQEIATAVAAATSKLELEYVKEKQSLQAQIENLRPELEANRARMRVEVEKEVRAEFEEKMAQYKLKVDQAKTLELEALLTTEKQKLAESMQEENMVVLRYKEREIRENCNATLEQQLQAKIQQSLQEQEKRLRAEHSQELEQATKKIKADHDLQLQAEVIQERARVSDKATNEKKILLQQQETNLQERFDSELAHKLAMQAQSLKQQYEQQIFDLQAKLQDAKTNAASIQHQTMGTYKPQISAEEIDFQAAATQARPKPRIAISATDLDLDSMLVPASRAESAAPAPVVDTRMYELEKQSALQAQEQRLRAEFAQELHKARSEWQLEQDKGIEHSHAQDLQACEQRLRREFQTILDQQRIQAAANFAKQRDAEVRANLARYKQKILNDMENARVNDLAAAEEALKEQYSARMQQHSELARVEIERVKEKLLAEQAEKIKHSVELQIEVMRKEQDRKFALYAEQQDAKLKELVEEERKKLHVKFAEDKANLIKDLTAKFTREKHIAMNKYETELREKLYKEMVKQKDFIQSKYTQTQEAALQEQKRRLEAQHKQEIERIKQGYFDPAGEHSKHDLIVAERNVEELADKILAKFQKQT